MVKLIVIARCVPEDVYLRSLESPVNAHLVGEKKFSVVVREPEEWYIGRLAIEIKNRYESLYKRQFGQIKYLKDNDDDCDLDPELYVADLLVDEGKAARDGTDQKRVVKVIQEQGRATREGSVIPDLTPVHYQPPTRPPVPRFPVVDEARTEERQADNRPTKRRRLDQIEEEANDVVSSIERDAVNGYQNGSTAILEPKIESPEIPSTWINTGPATRDELELLPEAPAHFQSRTRKNGINSRKRQHPGPEIRESSVPPQHNGQQQRTVDRLVPQQSLSHAQEPITPPNTGNTPQTTTGQVVSMLNSMKSKSPVARQPLSASASRFRKPTRNVYDYPESDIDDTQMSPQSRASRTKITPKLVQTPHRKDGSSSAVRARSDSRQTPTTQYSAKRVTVSQSDAMDIDGDEEAQLPPSKHFENSFSHQEALNKNVNGEDVRGEGDVPERIEPARGSFNTERSSVLGSDETWSIAEDGTRTKRQKGSRLSRNQRRSTGNTSTTRSSSIASSRRESSNADNPAQRRLKRKHVAPTRLSDVQSRDDISDLDSPGVQLSETLRQSSPAKRQLTVPEQSNSEQTSKSSSTQPALKTTNLGDAENDVIQRPPDSVSESEEDMPPLKTPKRTKTGSKPPKAVDDAGLRCLTCWTKKNRCDNLRPKCSSCFKNKKTCQIFDMTRAEATEERAKRQAKKSAKKEKPSQEDSSKARNIQLQSQGDTTSGSDRAVDSEDENGTKVVGVSQTQVQNSPLQKFKKQVASRAPGASTSASDRDDSLDADDKTGASRRAQATSKNLKTSKSTRRVSEEAVSASDVDMNSEVEEEKGTPIEGLQRHKSSVTQPKIAKEKKGKTKRSTTVTSPRAGEVTVDHIEGKEAIASSSDAAVFASIEPTAAVVRQSPKESSAGLVGNVPTRERSVESHVTNNSKILPPGMTQDEYDSLIGSRADLTEEQRKRKKMLFRKLGKQKDASPSLVRGSSSQDLVERSRQDTPSAKSDLKAPNSTQTTSKPPPSSQPAQVSVTPSSVPPLPPKSTSSKPQPTPGVANTSKAKLKFQPAANNPAEVKSQNPPFRPHQALSQSLRKSILSTPTTSTASPSLTTSRSLKDIRVALKSQSQSGSGASTPQPISTTAARIAQMRREADKKPVFSLSDDGDEESDDEDTDSEEEKKEPVRAAGKLANGNGPRATNATVRRRTPSDSGSASESDSGSSSGGESESESESTGSSESDESEDEDS